MEINIEEKRKTGTKEWIETDNLKERERERGNLREKRKRKRKREVT